MSSYPSSTSYTPEKSAAALNILSNFGLEINDLALLSDLPEELITAESLPRLLMEIKTKRMIEENTALRTSCPRPSTLSSSQSSSRPAAVSKATQSLSNLLKHIRSQPVQHPLDHAFLANKHVSPPVSSHKTAQMQPTIKTPIFSPPAQQYSQPMSAQSPVIFYQTQIKQELASKANPTTSAYSSILQNSCHSTVRSHPAPAQISPDLRKSIWGRPANTGLDTFNSPPGLRSFNVGRTGYINKASSSSRTPAVDYIYAEPSASYHKSNVKTTPSVPPIKAARDFYGQKPSGYPYTCSLCHTTAYTETFWLGHVNEQRHSDGQLELLQKFPDWDCRIETVREVTEMRARHGQQPSNKVPKCPSSPIQKKKRRRSSETEVKEKKINNDKDEDKVVCVKFARDSVSETGLKLLVKPFGEVVGFDLYHEFAFLEMRSAKEAKDTVEYFLKNPLTNSKVIRFFPVPSGKRWCSELITAATRFGPVIDHYFLSTQVFLEMLDPKDAKLVVEHYLSAPLIIEEETVEVTFSTEYYTLKTLCSTKLLAEELRMKRRRISSPRRKSCSPKRRIRCPKRRDSISHPQGMSKVMEKERKREENKDRNERRDKPQSSSTHNETSSAKPAPSTLFKPEAKDQTSNQGRTIQTTPTNHSEPAYFNGGLSPVSPNMLVSYDSDSDVEGIRVIWDEEDDLDDEAMETVDETDGDEDDDENGLTETLVTEKNLKENESKEEVPEPPEHKTSGLEIMHAAPSEEPPASVSEPERDGEEQGETLAEKKLEKHESKEEVPEPPEHKTSGLEIMHAAPPDKPQACMSESQRYREERGETPAERKLEQHESKEEVPGPPEQKTSCLEIMHAAPSEEPPASVSESQREGEEQGETPAETKLGVHESKEEVPEPPEHKTSRLEIMHAAPPDEPQACMSESQRYREEQGDTPAERKLEEQKRKEKVPEPPEQKTSGLEIIHVAPPEEPPASVSEPQRDEEKQGETPAGTDGGKKIEPKKEENKVEAPEQNQISGEKMQDAVPPVEPAIIGSEPKRGNEAQGDTCHKGPKNTRRRKTELVAGSTCEQNAGRTTRSSRRSAQLHDPLSSTYPRVVLIKSSFEKEMRCGKINLQSLTRLSLGTTLKGVTKDICSDKYGSTNKSSDEANDVEKSSETEESTEKDVSTAMSIEKEHPDQDAIGKEALPQHEVETSVEMSPAKEGPMLVTPKQQETIQETCKRVLSLRKRGKRCNARSSKAKGKLSKENAKAECLEESTEVEEENTTESTESAKMEVNQDTGKVEMEKQTANADKVEERPMSSTEEQPTRPVPKERTAPEAERKDAEPMSEEAVKTGPNTLQTALYSQAEVTEPTVEKLGQPKQEEKVGSTVLKSFAPSRYACGAEPIFELTLISVPEECVPDEDPSKTRMDVCELSDPVGTEFVRPVVGFFCNLCKVFYANEDEAMQKHCRSPSHFKRFKEHSGKEPKSSS